MLRRLLLSAFLALAITGVSFYLVSFAGLIWAAISGPPNPANAPNLQAGLRHWALPACAILGGFSFVLAFYRSGKATPR